MPDLARLPRSEAWEYALAVQEPKLTVDPGESFVLETNDAFNGTIQSGADHFSPGHLGPVWENRKINPTAGPVHVRGAEPGDALVIEIEDIEPVGRGFIATEENRGPLVGHLRHPEAQQTFTRMVDFEAGPSGTTSDGTAHIEGGLSWGLAPMVGCIGVAPLRPEQGNDTATMQCRYGGNLDVTDFRKGHKLIVPVAHAGGLLYAGDVHASQATEFSGTPIETAANIRLKCQVLKAHEVPFVRVETPVELIQIASQRPWDDAVRQAYLWMMDWLVDEHKMPEQDTVLHFNANPGVRVRVYCTSIDAKTRGSVGVSFPKEFLA
ncbi:hypothetical protein FPZ12_007265 [Amycolatopsis acidicola]|uniref:Acetamidase n=1 Tax=Amycolatopsis acidicola TaxID=2596893 RepID=A0A5N0VDK8_9PSEU|nr:acetamidase/formamidase family protein [Amycolatopsis acidicola]KAA9164386.1 hypothetical protein FPZ12_007265 [Amycolatopsis acidicola]